MLSFCLIPPLLDKVQFLHYNQDTWANLHRVQIPQPTNRFYRIVYRLLVSFPILLISTKPALTLCNYLISLNRHRVRFPLGLLIISTTYVRKNKALTRHHISLPQLLYFIQIKPLILPGHIRSRMPQHLPHEIELV